MDKLTTNTGQQCLTTVAGIRLALQPYCQWPTNSKLTWRPPPSSVINRAGSLFPIFFLTITDGERALVYRGSLKQSRPEMLVYFTLGFKLSAFPDIFPVSVLVYETNT